MATTLQANDKRSHSEESGRPATDTANLTTGSASPASPSSSSAYLMRLRSRSLRRRCLLDAGGLSAAPTGTPRVVAARLRPFPGGDNSPADIGECARCSLTTGKPVVGEEKNDTLRVLNPLCRVTAVAVDGSPLSAASSGRCSHAPVGLGGGGVSVRGGCKRAANGADALTTDGDGGLGAEAEATVSGAFRALNGFFLRARPLIAAAAGTSDESLPVRVGVDVAAVTKGAASSATVGTGGTGVTFTPGVDGGGAIPSAAAAAAVNVSQEEGAAGAVHGASCSSSPRADSVTAGVDDGGSVVSSAEGGGGEAGGADGVAAALAGAGGGAGAPEGDEPCCGA